MARMSLSAQLEAALLRANKAEAELLDLKQINAILRSKAYPQHKPNPKLNTIPSLADKAREYCAAHGVRSCTKEQVLNWNP